MGGKDTIVLHNVSDCSQKCPFLNAGDGRFRCIKYNGGSVVEVAGGYSKGTLYEFGRIAPCMVRKHKIIEGAPPVVRFKEEV